MVLAPSILLNVNIRKVSIEAYNMKWKRIVRASGLVEWQCEHGVGHPDQSSVITLTYLTGQTGWGIHGCDRCCMRDDFPGKRKRVEVVE